MRTSSGVERMSNEEIIDFLVSRYGDFVLYKPPLTSRTLLDGANEVQIEHYGSVYRLRLTALGKLILTK